MSYEHLRRRIGCTVGFLIVVIAIWLARAEPRGWVRRLGYIALAAVVAQAILGGITVLWYLPDAVSIAHASLAQIVFCLTTAIALVTSRGWTNGYAADRNYAAGFGAEAPRQLGIVNDPALQRIAIVTTALIYVQ